MQFGYNERCHDHETGEFHPDSSNRIRAILDEVGDSERAQFSETEPIGEATAEQVHEREYLGQLREFCETGGGTWEGDTVASEATYEAALASAGSAVWAVERALEGPPADRTPFALCRPPGHHAVGDDAMGFCFLDNAAIAAEVALDDPEVDRVAILDWDVHHGNGIQEAFYDRADVLYVSIHERGLFPGTGSVEETGEGAGHGTTVNLPFPPKASTPDYLAAVDRALGPRIEAFDPDLLVVSAGFDAHEDDPTSRAKLAGDGFGLLASRVGDVAAGSDAGLAFVLEGGYHLDALADGVRSVHESLCGRDVECPSGDPDPESVELVDAIRSRTVSR